jgi:hypothetical protein
VKRLLITALSLVPLLLGSVTYGGFWQLSFDSAHSGTLADKDGYGTGFTHRLPGTGASIPANDPNLTLDTANGQLILGSTRSDFNTTGWGRNLTGIEAPSLRVQGLGLQDFRVEARFDNVQVNQASDQIGIFAGASANLLLRGGVHEQNLGSSYQGFLIASENGADRSPGGGKLNLFRSGDDARFRMERLGGIWSFSWENLTTGATHQTTPFSDASLNAIDDYYFGVFNHDARNNTPQDAYLQYFSLWTGGDVNPVPEPASIAMWGLAGALGLVIARRRKRMLVT